MPHQLSRRYLQIIALVAVAVLTASCSSDERRPAPAAAELTAIGIASMTLAQDEFGPQFKDFVASPQSGLLTNKELVKRTPLDQKDRVGGSAERLGRRSGYRRFFQPAEVSQDIGGVWLIGSAIDVYGEESGAADALNQAKTGSP